MLLKGLDMVEEECDRWVREQLWQRNCGHSCQPSWVPALPVPRFSLQAQEVSRVFAVPRLLQSS